MQIPADVIKALEVLEENAKSLAFKRQNSMRFSYDATSSAYEECAMRWVQSINHFLPDKPENACARLDAFNKVLPIYDSSRGYYFKYINEVAKDLSLADYEKLLLMETNIYSLVKHCGQDSVARQSGVSERVQHIHKRLAAKYVGQKEYERKLNYLLADSANMLSILGMNQSTVDQLYRLTARFLLEPLTDSYTRIKAEVEELFLREDITQLYSDRNLAAIDNYLQYLNDKYAELASFSPLVMTLNMAEKDDGCSSLVKSKFQELETNIRALEANIGAELEIISTFQNMLFEQGYKIKGIESINNTYEDPAARSGSTLRRRF